MARVDMPAWATMKMFAGEFSASATYAVGAWVAYQGEAWKCHTAVSSAGAWTGATNWTKIPLAELMDAIKAYGDDTNAKISALYTQALSGAVEPLIKAAILSRNPAIPPSDDPTSWPNSIRSLRSNSTQPIAYWTDGSLVQFLDYYGNVVASLTDAQARDAIALPAVPAESGYTAIGWDWTLEEVRSAPGRITVRPVYKAEHPELGSKFVVEMDADALSSAPTLTFRGASLASGHSDFSVDWGDGTVQTGLTTAASATHTYETAGTYTVTVSDDLAWFIAPQSIYITRAIQWGSNIEGTSNPSSEATAWTYRSDKKGTYSQCAGLLYPAPWEDGITSAIATYRACSALRSMTAWRYSKITALSKNASIYAKEEGTWCDCKALSGSPMPWSDLMTDVTAAYCNCINLKGAVPEWGPAITTCGSASYFSGNTNQVKAGCYQGCIGLTGTIPAWNTAIVNAFACYWGCKGLTGMIPAWSAGITFVSYCYSGCTGLTGVWDDPNAIDNPPTPDDADLMPAHITTKNECVTGASAALRAYFLTSWGGTRAS